jgi:hypothetical protein
MAGGVDAYAPIGVPKPIGRDIWIVDGPVVRMRYGLGSLPFPTRMTVVRLPDGRLWLHSPVKITSGLVPRIEALGPVAALVAPNRLHWMALGEWQEVFPEAVTWAAPGVRPRRGFRIDHVLDDDSPSWGGAIAQLLVPGRFMTEAVFLHRDSRTLILTDLIENFERRRVHGWLLRLLTSCGSPFGGARCGARCRRCSTGRPSGW